MIMLLGIGVLTTFSILYMGNKGWHALHRMAGITPGVLIYKDPSAPLNLANMSWQRLTLSSQHLSCLSDQQLRQLQDIDRKVVNYHNYQQSLQQQNITPALTEQQFVLHKLLQQRLPEMLASHYHLVTMDTSANVSDNHIKPNAKQIEAGQLLQAVLHNIDQRLDSLLAQMETQHLQDMRVMKRYLDTHVAD